ncbi:MAG: TldD/PmbA family protein [bacterium]|nr:TldD/PmbA family protein [bacterium]
MLGEQKLKQITKKVLSYTKADEAEVLLFVSDNGLTRFANSQIHQNVASEDLGLSVRAVFMSKSGARIGVASGNSFDDSALKDAAKRAVALARIQKEDPDFVGLPKKQKTKYLKLNTKQATADERAKAVSIIIKQAKEKGIIASGAYDSSISEVAVANSNGVFAYHIAGASDLSTILLGKDSTGFGTSLAKDPKNVDSEKVAKQALDKALGGAKPKDLKPGVYEVILEPQAVNEMISFFAWLGPNARLYHEKASNFSGKLGKKVFGKNITIVDDPLDQTGFPMPFDFEGYPKQKLEIIKNGVLKNLVYDSYHANKYKAKNTGHALPAPNTSGPIPLHLRLEPGKKSLEQMIKGVKKGLLVTRLWYVRFLNPRSMAITGMTRDGTFLIENGKIKGAVRNLRFNQSIPEALNNVVAIGKDLENLASWETELGTNKMPALHIKKWNFTSSTEF